MSLKPSRRLAPEQKEALKNPATKIHRVVVEVTLAENDPVSETTVRDAMMGILNISRPNFIRAFRVVGYSKVQSGETRKLKNALRKAGADEDTEVPVIKQKGRKL
jgi:hypothetical protein